MRMETVTEYQRIMKVFRELKAVCTCGWPTEDDANRHAPDCEIEYKWDEAKGIVEDQDSEKGHE